MTKDQIIEETQKLTIAEIAQQMVISGKSRAVITITVSEADTKGKSKVAVTMELDPGNALDDTQATEYIPTT